GLAVEIVVVDNNSGDDTRAVIESLAGRLPVRYLFEPRPGKNCALNCGLRYGWGQSASGDGDASSDGDASGNGALSGGGNAGAGAAGGRFGRLGVFTDDDVTARPDWLQQSRAAGERWADCDVFGGKIGVAWPIDPPGWARTPLIAAFGFAQHDYAPDDRLYADGDDPFGPNMWVRRAALRPGLCFDEK